MRKNKKHNLNFKGILTLAGAYVSTFFGTTTLAEPVQPFPEVKPIVQYETFKSAGEKAGRDGSFSLEEIISYLPEGFISQITEEATTVEDYKQYLHRLGLDLDKENDQLIDNLSKVLSEYNLKVNEEIKELKSLSDQFLDAIKNTSEGTETAYEIITENLDKLNQLTSTLEKQTYEFNDLSEILLVTYFAAKENKTKSNEIVELAKKLYPRSKDAAFGFRFYDNSQLKETQKNLSKVIKTYENEKKRLENELSKANDNYLVMSSQEIESRKKQIEDLENRVNSIQENLNKITKVYDSTLELLAEIAKNSNSVINAARILENMDSSYNSEKKAEISGLISAITSYKNNEDPNVSWELRNISPTLKWELSTPYSPKETIAVLLGIGAEASTKDLVRKTDVSAKELSIKEFKGEVSGKVVSNLNSDNIFLVVSGKYSLGNRLEEISSKVPIEFRDVNEELISESEYNIGFYGVLNEKNGLLGRLSLDGSSKKQGMNKSSDIGLTFGLNLLDYSSPFKGEIKVGFGLNEQYQIQLDEIARNYYWKLGANLNNLKIFNNPSELELAFKKYSNKDTNFSGELRINILEDLKTTFSIYYLRKDKESETKLGFGVNARF